MTSLTRDEWMQMNHMYLIASIDVVKAELLTYLDSLNRKKTFRGPEHGIEHAKRKVSKLEKRFTVQPALNTLTNLFNLSSFEKKILLVCAGQELDKQFSGVISTLLSNTSRESPSLSMLLAAFSDAHWSAITPEGPLRYWHFIELNKSNVLTNATCSIDEQILHYLTGIDYLDHRLKDLVKIIHSEGNLVLSHQKLSDILAEHVSRFMNAGNYPLVQLCGGSIEDSMSIVAEAFAGYKLSAYQLPVHLLPTNFQELSNLILLWNRVALLNRYVLYLDGSQLESIDQTLRSLVNHLIENIQGIVILGSDKRISGIKRGLLTIDVQKPLPEEQEILWKQQLGSVAETMNKELGEIVTQFNLDTHTIKKVATQAALTRSSNGTSALNGSKIKEEVWRACCNHTRPNLERLAQRIEPFATWDDLVLPEMQNTILKEIGVHVQHRQKVYYDWGFASKSKRGLGISALFTGESGTGKTMASEVLANELQLDLYRIDLSQVVNKYIGETEKNLKRIFDAAEESGAILLFDEADALFGKRSEVKDSHDRYSNIEVSYLLQKMEAYRGLAILTTNMKNALDKAFLRRIRFVVHFPFPDADMRTKIWKRVFPIQTPTNNLNVDKLSSLHIAGGTIKNIALNASFAAAGNNQSVSMADIQNAARNEYIKLEKQMSSSESIL